MLLVDSSVWIDYFNGTRNSQTDYLDCVLDQVPVLVGDLILAEVLQGFEKDSEYMEAHDLLLRFTSVDMLNRDLAVKSAQNFRYLRKRGVTVRKTIDSLIATFCIENDHELLHKDHDFDGYAQYLGLRVIHP